MDDEKTILDDAFGVLTWNDRLGFWGGGITIPLQENVEIELPESYADSAETQARVRDLIGVIRRDELSFRQRTADTFLQDSVHRFWWPSDQPFDRDVFIRNMYLVCIQVHEDGHPDDIALYYEYGDDVAEHGIIMRLSPGGAYLDAGEF